MSLIRQIWLLLLATLLLAFAASVSVNIVSALDTLQTQLSLKNSDNATALAQVLSQQKGQRELMELVTTAQFDTGFYRRIRFIAVDGTVLFEREAASAPLHAPGWFTALLPIAPVPGRAQVSDGWRALGAIEVVSQSAYAHDQLWRGSVRAAAALGGVGLVAGLLAWFGVGRIRRPLNETVEQAASLQRGEYLTVAEPKVPELRRLTRAMNSMVARLRVVFEGQAAQVESLRRQATGDAVSGLSNRAHFMAQLGAALQREDGPARSGLVLLRVLRLAEVNRMLGHVLTDRLIGEIGGVLRDQADLSAGAFAGRLNGADFALALPEGGVALANAQAIVEQMRVVLATMDVAVTVAAGGVELGRGTTLAAALAAVDLALARAEAAGAPAVETAGEGGAAWAREGERGWHDRLIAALVDGRAQLGSFPVVDRAGALLHLECPLRLRLEPEGPFEVAAHWLPLATRTRLTCEVDERALALALAATLRDGQPRGVNLSPVSLLDSGFSARLCKQLDAAPRAARAIWLEVHESAAAEHFDLVRELARQVRASGARIGLEHAGERLSRIDRLFEAGLDYVKLDAAIGAGVALDPGRAGYARGLVTMLHSLSLQVIVEGVADAADAQVLRDLGVDGLTGPCVTMPPV